jgi:hypothetical protein
VRPWSFLCKFALKRPRPARLLCKLTPEHRKVTRPDPPYLIPKTHTSWFFRWQWRRRWARHDGTKSARHVPNENPSVIAPLESTCYPMSLTWSASRWSLAPRPPASAALTPSAADI